MPQAVFIDATHKHSADLLPALSRLLYAATPSQLGDFRVAIFCPDNDTTDWPDQNWLDVVSDDASARLDAMLQQLPDAILVSLNGSRHNQVNQLLLISDWIANQQAPDNSPSGLLGRIKTRIAAGSVPISFDDVNSVITLSHYAKDKIGEQLENLEDNCQVISPGINPEFFRPLYTHRLIDRLSIDAPFMWLSIVTHESIDDILLAVTAVESLRKLGAFVELKLLVHKRINTHELDKEDLRRLSKAVRQRSFVEVVHVDRDLQMLEHYHSADGFIWGQETDRNHPYLINAMASGLPVIAASTPMNKIHLGSKLRFFRPTDEGDLASTLERSMADIHFRIIGSARNHKRSMHYTWERMAAEFFKLLQDKFKLDRSAEAVAS